MTAELDDPRVLALGCPYTNGGLVAAVRVRLAGPDPTIAEISRLNVAPDRQRTGLGTRLGFTQASYVAVRA